MNPHGGMLFDRPVYKSITEVPDPADLAVLLVPPQVVMQSLQELAGRGIHAAIISTGGFKETGQEGAELEKQVAKFADTHGIRFVGPNCVGLINTHYPLDTTFLQPPGPPAGEIAFLSHSGAICAAVIDWIRGQGGGLSHLISLGNQADVTETDMLPEVAQDENTRVITLYLEGIKDGRRFIETASNVTRSKPIIALKVGRSESGKKAAASHTGALAGHEIAYDTAFNKSGVLRAETTEEMFQWARAFAWSPLPKGNRIAVLTNSGGPGVTAVDAMEKHHLKLADLDEKTKKQLKKFLPPAASLNNPVDMLASATPEQFAGSLKLLLEDDGVDGIVVISPPPPPSTIGAVVKAMIPVIQTYPEKPVLFSIMGSTQIGEGLSLLHAMQLPDYRFPEAAVSAMGALVRYAEYRRSEPKAGSEMPGIQKKKAAIAVEKSKPGQWMGQDELNSMMEAYGIHTNRLELASTPDEAVKFSTRIGYPVVLKLASKDLLHKSDIGGVLVGIQSADEVKVGFNSIIQRAKKADPSIVIEGVYVQKMAGSGQEVITGFIRDPQFGPMIMFGSGGVEVEGMRDVAFGLSPLSRNEAEKMVDATWAGKKLNGFRNIPAADRSAVVDVLMRLSQLAEDLPELQELEINPLRVLAPEKGAVAIDVRARK